MQEGDHSRSENWNAPSRSGLYLLEVNKTISRKREKLRKGISYE
jgi:hypothetical protein